MSDRQSQCAEILRALKAGERMTPLDALFTYGVFRLAARIKDLRDDGYLITTEIIELKSSGKKVAEYRLARQKRVA